MMKVRQRVRGWWHGPLSAAGANVAIAFVVMFYGGIAFFIVRSAVCSLRAPTGFDGRWMPTMGCQVAKEQEQEWRSNP
jgi:hypothetical protein